MPLRQVDLAGFGLGLLAHDLFLGKMSGGEWLRVMSRKNTRASQNKQREAYYVDLLHVAS